MLTDNEYVLIKRIYNMAGDMVSSLTKIAGPTPQEGFRPLVKDELIKHAIELEHIKIRLGKILNGTAGY
jgi:hypothetical protein